MQILVKARYRKYFESPCELFPNVHWISLYPEMCIKWQQMSFTLIGLLNGCSEITWSHTSATSNRCKQVRWSQKRTFHDVNAWQMKQLLDECDHQNSYPSPFFHKNYQLPYAVLHEHVMGYANLNSSRLLKHCYWYLQWESHLCLH